MPELLSNTSLLSSLFKDMHIGLQIKWMVPARYLTTTWLINFLFHWNPMVVVYKLAAFRRRTYRSIRPQNVCMPGFPLWSAKVIH